MNIIPPTTVTEAMLTYSSVAEPSANDAAIEHYGGEYAAGVTYTEDSIVAVVADHKLYISLQNGNVGNTPGGTGNDEWWTEYDSTERWKLFDAKVGSQVESAGTITYTLDPGGPIDSVALLNVEAASIHVVMTDTGATLATIGWTETTVVDGLIVSDVVKLDFPLTYLTPTITVTVSPYLGYAKIGEMVIGQKKSLGNMKTNPSVGIIDYSIKEVDDFGNYTILERAYSKRLTCMTNILNTQLDATYDTLATVRATAVVWVGSEDYSSMIVYGFFKDFSIDLAYLKYSVCSLEIEGLV